MAILTSRWEKILSLLILLGLFGALWAGWLRYREEAANTGVDIILDGREVLQLSEITGKTPAEIAKTFKQAGATGLAVEEASLEDLVAEGVADISPWAPLGQKQIQLFFADKATAHAVAEALQTRFPGLELENSTHYSYGFIDGHAKWFGIRQPQRFPLWIGEYWDKLADTKLILDPTQIAAAQAVGLRLAARLPNTPSAQPKAITFSLESAKQAGADLVIFDEEEVLGYDGLLDYTAKELRRLGLVYGWVELAAQRGEDTLRSKMWDQMLRVHGISDKELPRLRRDTVVSRLLRAARERDIRVCYTRLLLRPEADVLAYNADFIAEIASGLKQEGLTLGQARPYPPVKVPLGAILLMHLGIAAAAALLAGRLLPLKTLGSAIVLVLLSVFMLGLFMTKPLLGRQVAGLLTGLTFATLGVILAWQTLSQGVESQGSGSHLLKAVGWTIFVVLVSLIGGLLIGGMLTETHFIVGAEQFRGVKLLLLGPVLLVILAIVAGLESPISSPQAWGKHTASSLRVFFCRPALVIELSLVLLALAAVGVLVIRSGNAASAAAPAVEAQARAGLETLLWARPRTKEFLVALPALFLFFWLRAGRKRKTKTGGNCALLGWQEILPIIGVIGPASIADTFCHLHTPLLLSLVRTLNGLWLGLVVGGLALFTGFIIKAILHLGAVPPARPES